MMQGSPNSSETQVTLANWRQAPWSSWAFHHVREVLPTADIRHDPQTPWVLTEAPVNLGGVNIDLDAGGVMSIAGFIDAMHIDACLVMHRDKIVFEQYRHGMDKYQPHILFSVSKSITGLVCGILEHQGVLEPALKVTDYIPELNGTAYHNTTVRQLLDMRTAVDFVEDYTATEGAIIDYRHSTGWDPLPEGVPATDLRSFLQSLTATDGDNGGPFAYKSPNTDLLAWVIERACEKPFAQIISDTLWQPLGAATSAYVTVDRLGAPRAAGGICTTLRDLALVGRLLVQHGQRDGNQILPTSWIDDLIHNGDQNAWAQGNFAERFPGLPMSYRSKWYAVHASDADESHWNLAVGIHGQNIYVDAKNEFVMIKFASSPQPLSDSGPLQSFLAARAIRDYLVNHF